MIRLVLLGQSYHPRCGELKLSLFLNLYWQYCTLTESQNMQLPTCVHLCVPLHLWSMSYTLTASGGGLGSKGTPPQLYPSYVPEFGEKSENNLIMVLNTFNISSKYTYLQSWAVLKYICVFSNVFKNLWFSCDLEIALACLRRPHGVVHTA